MACINGFLSDIASINTAQDMGLEFESITDFNPEITYNSENIMDGNTIMKSGTMRQQRVMKL